MNVDRHGGKGAVMVDVARRVGVSQKTVSRVVNGAPHVRPEVRERVLAAIAELNYRPNLSARALVTQRTHLIGVVAVATSLYGPAARVFSLEHAARESGYEIALSSLPDMSPVPIRAAVEGLLRRGCEGIVLELPRQSTDIDDALLAGVPVATRVAEMPRVSRQAVVSSDQTAAGRTATQHLLDLGHETVWHIAGPADWDVASERRRGWAEALADAGRDRPQVLQGDWSARSGYVLGRLLAAQERVTAVFTANDHQAMGVIRALTEAGRPIPAAVSVVGFDDVPEAEYQSVPLTTVRTDDDALSRQVLAALVALIEGREPESMTVETSYELVQRASTGPPPPVGNRRALGPRSSSRAPRRPAAPSARTPRDKEHP